MLVKEGRSKFTKAEKVTERRFKEAVVEARDTERTVPIEVIGRTLELDQEKLAIILRSNTKDNERRETREDFIRNIFGKVALDMINEMDLDQDGLRTLAEHLEIDLSGAADEETIRVRIAESLQKRKQIITSLKIAGSTEAVEFDEEGNISTEAVHDGLVLGAEFYLNLYPTDTNFLAINDRAEEMGVALYSKDQFREIYNSVIGDGNFESWFTTFKANVLELRELVEELEFYGAMHAENSAKAQRIISSISNGHDFGTTRLELYRALDYLNKTLRTTKDPSEIAYPTAQQHTWDIKVGRGKNKGKTDKGEPGGSSTSSTSTSNTNTSTSNSDANGGTAEVNVTTGGGGQPKVEGASISDANKVSNSGNSENRNVQHGAHIKNEPKFDNIGTIAEGAIKVENKLDLNEGLATLADAIREITQNPNNQDTQELLRIIQTLLENMEDQGVAPEVEARLRALETLLQTLVDQMGNNGGNTDTNNDRIFEMLLEQNRQLMTLLANRELPEIKFENIGNPINYNAGAGGAGAPGPGGGYPWPPVGPGPYPWPPPQPPEDPERIRQLEARIDELQQQMQDQQEAHQAELERINNERVAELNEATEQLRQANQDLQLAINTIDERDEEMRRLREQQEEDLGNAVRGLREELNRSRRRREERDAARQENQDLRDRITELEEQLANGGGDNNEDNDNPDNGNGDNPNNLDPNNPDQPDNPTVAVLSQSRHNYARALNKGSLGGSILGLASPVGPLLGYRGTFESARTEYQTAVRERVSSAISSMALNTPEQADAAMDAAMNVMHEENLALLNERLASKQLDQNLLQKGLTKLSDLRKKYPKTAMLATMGAIGASTALLGPPIGMYLGASATTAVIGGATGLTAGMAMRRSVSAPLLRSSRKFANNARVLGGKKYANYALIMEYQARHGEEQTLPNGQVWRPDTDILARADRKGAEKYHTRFKTAAKKALRTRRTDLLNAPNDAARREIVLDIMQEEHAKVLEQLEKERNRRWRNYVTEVAASTAAAVGMSFLLNQAFEAAAPAMAKVGPVFERIGDKIAQSEVGGWMIDTWHSGVDTVEGWFEGIFGSGQGGTVDANGNPINGNNGAAPASSPSSPNAPATAPVGPEVYPEITGDFSTSIDLFEPTKTLVDPSLGVPNDFTQMSNSLGPASLENMPATVHTDGDPLFIRDALGNVTGEFANNSNLVLTGESQVMDITNSAGGNVPSRVKMRFFEVGHAGSGQFVSGLYLQR